MTTTNHVSRSRAALRIAAVSATSAVLGLVAGSGLSTAAAPAPAGPDTSLQSQFTAAAKEFKVPENLLLAVSYQETRWDSHRGLPSTTGNYNVMGLTQVDLAAITAAQAANEPEVDLRGDGYPNPNAKHVPPLPAPVDSPALHTLDVAAKLIGRPAADLRTDTLQSIRGGAALLADFQKKATGTLPQDPAQWYGAVVRFSNGGQDVAGQPATGKEFADRVFGTLKVGAARTTAEGKRVVLPANPTAALHTPAVDRGTKPETASRGTVRPALFTTATTATDPIECPTTLTCDFQPAAYALTNPSDPTSYGNYSVANRGSSDVQYIVIHDTEGSYAGSITAFQDPNTQASAHYIVRSSDGHVTQLVATKNIAWHAGNKTVNMHSVGIEHEGYAVSGASWYSEQLYQSSAQLTRYLAGRYNVPLDRQHIIGHDDVPGPVQSSVAGMHWDPGTFWDWNHYMSLLGSSVTPDQGYMIGGRVNINPPFSTSYQPQINGVSPQPANFVYLYNAPNGSLIGSGTQNAADWSDKAVAGTSYVIADQQGLWTAIWYNGQKAWFWNDGSMAAADNRQGQYVVVPRAGATSIPVYGRSYPEDAAYTAANIPVPNPNIQALDATIPAGQSYVPLTTTPVAGDFYYAMNINGDAVPDRVWVTGTNATYYPIRYNHRLAYVSAADVQLVPAATNVLLTGERVQLLAQTTGGPVGAGANYTVGAWEKYQPVQQPGGTADPNGTFALTYTSTNQLHAVALFSGHLYTADRNLYSGQWTSWYDMQVSGVAGPINTVTGVTVAALGNKVHVIAMSGGSIFEAIADYDAGAWRPWASISGALGLPSGALGQLSAAAIGNVLHIVGVGSDGRIHMADGDYTAGTWGYGDVTSQIGQLSGPVTSLAAASIGSKLHVDALVNGRLSDATADYAAGSWYPWGDVSAATGQSGSISAFASATTGNSLRLFGVIGGRVYNANGDYTAGVWSGWGDTEAAGVAGPVGTVATLAVAGH